MIVTVTMKSITQTKMTVATATVTKITTAIII